MPPPKKKISSGNQRAPTTTSEPTTSETTKAPPLAASSTSNRKAGEQLTFPVSYFIVHKFSCGQRMSLLLAPSQNPEGERTKASAVTSPTLDEAKEMGDILEVHEATAPPEGDNSKMCNLELKKLNVRSPSQIEQEMLETLKRKRAEPPFEMVKKLREGNNTAGSSISGGGGGRNEGTLLRLESKSISFSQIDFSKYEGAGSPKPPLFSKIHSF